MCGINFIHGFAVSEVKTRSWLSGNKIMFPDGKSYPHADGNNPGDGCGRESSVRDGE